MAANARLSVSLGIHGETLEPDEVSALLGCQPTSSQRKDEMVVSGEESHPAETGGWFLESDLGADAEIESHVESIFSKLTADPDEWASLTTRYSAALTCRLRVADGGDSFEISPRLARALAKRGVVIGFEIESGGSA